ncbi:MAG: Delta-aminolevulinic acid dehydratase [Candidatus Bathyarchaeota archaeon B63]|nr:MAG: Delta-aminolevulinic acid dehydratase [Candidatus Bathyarchaeota archaeon B63]
MVFPQIRMRRLRKTVKIRDLVRETVLTLNDLVYPIFVKEGISDSEPIGSMPGQFRLPVRKAVEEAENIASLGIPAIILFGIPIKKDDAASSAYDPKGVVQRTVRSIKERLGDNLVVMTDICLCQYTTHGHCGVVEDGQILNDPTLEILRKIAVSHAEAGADVVAPSGMIDGQVQAIREALDHAGFTDVAVMAYSAKHASNFYGPFREAADSAPSFGDRRSYQMDYANPDEALREVELDIGEGADIVMVKPALAYLDLIYRIKTMYGVPTAAYNVSGEYSMIKAAAEMGWIDEKAIVLEVLTAIKRAGADMILTYFAKDAARWLIGDE